MDSFFFNFSIVLLMAFLFSLAIICLLLARNERLKEEIEDQKIKNYRLTVKLNRSCIRR